MTTRRAFLESAAAAMAAPMLNLGRFALPARSLGGQQSTYSARCIDLMKRALVIDMLAPLHLSGQVRAKWTGDPRTMTDADVAKFRGSGIDAMHMAVGWGGPDAYLDAMRYFMAHNALIAARSDLFTRVDGIADVARAKAAGRVGVILGAQNSDHFIKPGLDERDILKTVEEFWRYGQRVSQLTYNTMTWFGSGSTDRADGGLSDLGVELVRRMNKVGMAVDTAHCGDRTTLDAFEVSAKPVLVTHSNVRSLAGGHPRCKPDEGRLSPPPNATGRRSRQR